MGALFFWTGLSPAVQYPIATSTVILGVKGPLASFPVLAIQIRVGNPPKIPCFVEDGENLRAKYSARETYRRITPKQKT